MRKRFEQQTSLLFHQIESLTICKKSRDDIPQILRALKELYANIDLNSQIFELLEQKISKKSKGRPGMNLWIIFVLSQIRLGLNIDFDRLVNLANEHDSIRHLLGVKETSFAKDSQKHRFAYQTVVDNLSLLDDDTLIKINQVVVEMGHGIFKKKEEEALCLKSDSFPVPSNVHFPTDYNLLWDCARKCTDALTKLYDMGLIEGWREIKSWKKSFKCLMRNLGQSTKGGGANKTERQQEAAKSYLKKAKQFVKNINETKFKNSLNLKAIQAKLTLDEFKLLLVKHIALVERRILKEEKIPHSEKMFSVFETYTEWINKGKKHPSVELGKNVTITTDQFNLIIDHQIMENITDSEIVVQMSDRISDRHVLIESWSWDKGYYSKANKTHLQEKNIKVVMPKKGKKTITESAEESEIKFKKTRNQHSAVESNINELEHSGLDRCPDKSYPNYKRYVALGVIAYNLKRIGREIIRQEKEVEKRKRRKNAA